MAGRIELIKEVKLFSGSKSVASKKTKIAERSVKSGKTGSNEPSLITKLNRRITNAIMCKYNDVTDLRKAVKNNPSLKEAAKINSKLTLALKRKDYLYKYFEQDGKHAVDDLVMEPCFDDETILEIVRSEKKDTKSGLKLAEFLSPRFKWDEAPDLGRIIVDYKRSPELLSSWRTSGLSLADIDALCYVHDTNPQLAKKYGELRLDADNVRDFESVRSDFEVELEEVMENYSDLLKNDRLKEKSAPTEETLRTFVQNLRNDRVSFNQTVNVIQANESKWEHVNMSEINAMIDMYKENPEMMRGIFEMYSSTDPEILRLIAEYTSQGVNVKQPYDICNSTQSPIYPGKNMPVGKLDSYIKSYMQDNGVMLRIRTNQYIEWIEKSVKMLEQINKFTYK